MESFGHACYRASNIQRLLSFSSSISAGGTQAVFSRCPLQKTSFPTPPVPLKDSTSVPACSPQEPPSRLFDASPLCVRKFWCCGLACPAVYLEATHTDPFDLKGRRLGTSAKGHAGSHALPRRRPTAVAGEIEAQTTCRDLLGECHCPTSSPRASA